MDGRKNNKGKTGNKGGRKSKAEELKAAELGTSAIIDAYGSLDKYWLHIAKESKDSMPHLKMLTEYIYGKPTETKSIDVDGVIFISFED